MLSEFYGLLGFMFFILHSIFVDIGMLLKKISKIISPGKGLKIYSKYNHAMLKFWTKKTKSKTKLLFTNYSNSTLCINKKF